MLPHPHPHPHPHSHSHHDLLAPLAAGEGRESLPVAPASVPPAGPAEVERRTLLGGLVGGMAGAALLLGGRPNVAQAGPLTPPTGPVAPTPGPEPRIAINAVNTPSSGPTLFNITQPGSYYLTGNVTVPASGNGIGIATSNVTIDLNGFTISGGANGVVATLSSAERITIRNGSLINQTGRGILCNNNLYVTVENVSVSNTSFSGIHLGGSARVINCTVSNAGELATSSTAGGIWCDDLAVVSGCIVRDFVGGNATGGGGFKVGISSVVSDCTAANCTFNGFDVGRGSVVHRCAAFGCQHGFTAASQSRLNDCAAQFCVARGFSVSDAILAGCTAQECTEAGFRLSSGSTARNCSAATTPGTGSGFVLLDDASAHNCKVNGCSVGISAALNCVVTGCFVSGSTIGYTAAANAGAYFANNIAEGSPTSWVIGAGNFCLAVAATATTTAINGNSGGVSPGSGNPFANYTI